MPQAAAVNGAEDDVRIMVSRARLRKPLVVAQELARRFDLALENSEGFFAT
jgi:hypothetical protein